MIPEKYKNTCPLDHSTYEKYIECNCNFGSANEVWYFKEQELAKLREENEKLKKTLTGCHKYIKEVPIDCGFVNEFLALTNTIEQCLGKETLGE